MHLLTKTLCGFTARVLSGEVGVIEGSFGKSDKFKVHFQQALPLVAADADDSKVRQVVVLTLFY